MKTIFHPQRDYSVTVQDDRAADLVKRGWREKVGVTDDQPSGSKVPRKPARRANKSK